MTEFSFTETVDVRFQDHDTLGHVNNAVYVTYMEQGRLAYLTDGVGMDPNDLDMVVANLKVDFRRPVEFAREVEVGVSVTNVGESSFTMTYEVRDDEGVVVEGTTVQVMVDPETKSSKPVPEELRAAFDELEQ